MVVGEQSEHTQGDNDDYTVSNVTDWATESKADRGRHRVCAGTQGQSVSDR